GGRGVAVLTGPRLGNHPGLAHAPRDQRLPDRVVDLVRSGVKEVFALQINLRAAEFAREAFGEVKRCRAYRELTEIILQLALELRVLLASPVLRLEFLERMHQRFGHVPASVRTKAPRLIGQGGWRFRARTHDRAPYRRAAHRRRKVFQPRARPLAR